MAGQRFRLQRSLRQPGKEEAQSTGIAQHAIGQILCSGEFARGFRGAAETAAAQTGQTGRQTAAFEQNRVDQLRGEQARGIGWLAGCPGWIGSHAVIVAEADASQPESMHRLRIQEIRGIADSHLRAPGGVISWRLAMSNVETLRHDLVGIVGELHAALREIGSENMPQAGIVHNARDRLRYIATLTEQSASQTLRAAESISDRLHTQLALAQHLQRKVRSPAAREFLLTLESQHAEALGQISEIIQAQAFQDLVGQVINKLMLTVEKMESSLAHLLLEEEPDPGLLAGPQIHAEEQVSQADIDNLFD
jgi:chemotaxis protein CheZ